MIISRAPLRVSLAGGGSDFPGYFQSSGGSVFSFAIDSFVYVALHKHFLGGFRLKYSRTEDVQTIQDIEHPLIREVLQEFDVKHSLEIASFADVPSSGSGLGSSSAFTIAMLNAVSALHGGNLSKSELANLACKIELEKCNEPIGKQDQFASAYGGINQIVFNSDGSTQVIPTKTLDSDADFLESCLSLFYLGFGRSASSILLEQKRKIETVDAVRQNVDSLKNLVLPTLDAVKRHDSRDLGNLIRLGWELKSSLATSISNSSIDSVISKVTLLGAYGAKIVGAGGGGFLLVCHPPGMGSYFAAELPNLRFLKFKISKSGAKIVYQDEMEISEGNE
jgi:D-glycero-alpha-D-manno-heptose-7-phosphate kinase